MMKVIRDIIVHVDQKYYNLNFFKFELYRELGLVVILKIQKKKKNICSIKSIL